MRFAASRRGREVRVEGKRNNWIPRNDQVEVGEHIGRSLGINKVGQQVTLRQGEEHYKECYNAAPDLSGENAKLRVVAGQIATAVRNTISEQVAVLREQMNLRTPSPAAYLKNEVIEQLNR